MMYKLGVIIISWCLWLPAQAKVAEYQLENGMQIVILENHRAPVVAHQVWYKVGSNYEPGGLTGISHMLEHMMFKDTKTLKTGEFSKRVSQMGGEQNAFTSSDVTAYYQIIGKQHLEAVMALEADRMRNMIVKDDEFFKERDVVAEERRWRTDDKPGSILYEQFMAAAFVNSPQQSPTVGWMTDIQHYQPQDVRDWYQKWYAPNNAILVVVGDVDPKQVLALAKKYYGPLKPETIQPPKPQIEIPQVGERRITIKGATKEPSMIMGFHVPSLLTAEQPEEVYALSVLSSVLDGDDSARLTQLIRGSQVATSVGAGYDETSRLSTLFLFNGSPATGHTLKDLETALWQEIKKLQEQPISSQELDRVLAQSEAQYVFHQDSLESQAMVLGSLVTKGLPADTFEHWIENLRKVTPAQVQAVAQKYFKADLATVGELLPNGQIAKAGANQITMGGSVH